MTENKAVSKRIDTLVQERAELEDRITKLKEHLGILINEEKAISTMVSALQRLVNPNRSRPGRGKNVEK